MNIYDAATDLPIRPATDAEIEWYRNWWINFSRNVHPGSIFNVSAERVYLA